MSLKTKLTFSSSEDEIIETSNKYQRKRKTMLLDSQDEFIAPMKKTTDIVSPVMNLIINQNEKTTNSDNENENTSELPFQTETDHEQFRDENNLDNELSEMLENTSFEESFSTLPPKKL